MKRGTLMIVDLIRNVAVGVVGGMLVGGFGYLHGYMKNRSLEKKFPLSGEYISKFEDKNKNGVKTTCTAPVKLKQKGKKITGTTTFAGKRTWILEGEVSDDGHIHGIYFAEDPVDKGIGNFFLKVDNHRNMSGLWSGYDSENGRIESGKYTFKHVNRKIVVLDFSDRYVTSIVSIADKQIGQDYISSELIGKCMADPENFIGKLAFDKEIRKVVGFSISYRVDQSQLHELIKVDHKHIPRMLTYARSLGVIKSIAVDDESKGQGIGTLLIEETMHTFKKRGIHTAFTVAWKSRLGTNLHGVLSQLNFEQLIELPNYWKEDSIKENFTCPVCGNPPCLCSAVIYGMNIA